MIRPAKSAFVIASLALLAVGAGLAFGGDFSSQANFGSSFFSASPPCPLKQFPTFESLVPVPNTIDPFQDDIIPMFCDIEVTKEGKGVRNARGQYQTDLIVIDNNTGQAESFPIQSGKFRTGSSGRTGFDFELPAELFADGFESGDVSAWSYTRTDFKRKKRAGSASVNCGKSTTSSRSAGN